MERLQGVTTEVNVERTWIVRFDAGDGQRRAGRLRVDQDHITFVGTTPGDSTVIIERSDVLRTQLVVDGLAESVILTLTDGRHVVVDHGVLPAAELARHLSAHPPTEVEPT